MEEAERNYNLEKLAQLKYGTLPDLEKKLEIREYYDIAAIGYLHAVQRYFTEKSLHRYRFSTIAWHSMNSSLNTFRRQEQRRQSMSFPIRLRIRRLTTPLMHFGQDCCCMICFSSRMKSRLF